MSTAQYIINITPAEEYAQTILPSTGNAQVCKLFWRRTEGILNTNVRITISQHFLRHKTDTKSEKIKCIQISLQHARLATDNLNKTIEEDSIDTLRIQEPYQIRNKIVGFPRGLKIFKAGAGKHRAAIGVNNAHIDTIMINQLSDEDAVVLELTLGNKNYYCQLIL